MKAAGLRVPLFYPRFRMESSKDTDLSFARDPNENEMSIGAETT